MKLIIKSSCFSNNNAFSKNTGGAKSGAWMSRTWVSVWASAWPMANDWAWVWSMSDAWSSAWLNNWPNSNSWSTNQ